MLLHVFAHVDAYHVALIVKESLRKCLCKLCLAHAGGAKEQEGAYGLVGILKARAGTENRVAHGLHSLVLTYYPAMQYAVKVQ